MAPAALADSGASEVAITENALPLPLPPALFLADRCRIDLFDG